MRRHWLRSLTPLVPGIAPSRDLFLGCPAVICPLTTTARGHSQTCPAVVWVGWARGASSRRDWDEQPPGGRSPPLGGRPFSLTLRVHPRGGGGGRHHWGDDCFQ